ncbi:MAG: exosortase/archaeosortase family protein [Candidatus Diapherotrites archaeon]
MLVWTVDLKFLEDWLAGTEAGFTGLQSKGNIIFLKEEKIEINPSCTGLISASILAAVIFSLRKPEIKKKILIFLGGTIILFLLNIARVYFVLLIGISYGAQTAEFAHQLTWLSTAAFIVILWYYFTLRITKSKEFHELL